MFAIIDEAEAPRTSRIIQNFPKSLLSSKNSSSFVSRCINISQKPKKNKYTQRTFASHSKSSVVSVDVLRLLGFLYVILERNKTIITKNSNNKTNANNELFLFKTYCLMLQFRTQGGPRQAHEGMFAYCLCRYLVDSIKHHKMGVELQLFDMFF